MSTNSKKPKVAVYNTLLKELHNKYVQMYKDGQVLEEDYNFVLDLELAKFNKDIEKLRTRFTEEDVLNKNPEVFPSEEVFWQYFPKLYSCAYKNKKDQKKFVTNNQDLKSILSQGIPEITQAMESSLGSGGLAGIQNLMSNPKFMELAQKMAKEIQDDPELLNSLKS